MRVILLGPPGSGKGTQSDLIRKKYGFPKISTGDLLREAVAKGTSLGRLAESQMRHGGLVEDEVVIGLVRERIAESDCTHGYILDGFPRNQAQAERLEQIDGERPEVAIKIQVAENILIERLTARRICAGCGAIFHLHSAPSKEKGICDSCGKSLIQRDDDQPEVVRERLKVYRRKTEPLIGYYKRKGRFYSVDGSREVEEIFKKIASVLDREMGRMRESEALR